MTNMMDKCLQFVSCSTVKDESDSGYLELEQSDRFDFHLVQLSLLEKLPLVSEKSPWADQMVEKIRSCKSDLSFLKMFFLSVSTLEISHISTYNKPFLCFPSINNTKHEMECLILDLQDDIQNCKQEFQELLGGDSSKNRMTLPLLGFILQNLKDVYKFKTDDEIILLNSQISTLEKKVKLLHNLLDHLARVQWMDFVEMRAFEVVVHVFAQYSARLVFLYWVKPVDEDMVTQLNIMMSSNVLHKYEPCVPAFKSVFIRFLEELKSRQFDSLLLGQIIPIILDLLLENLVDILKDGFLNFQESLMFVISFLAQPLDEHRGDEDWKMLSDEIEVLVQEDLYLVLSFHAMNGDFSEANTRLSDFTRNVEQVKGKILQAYDRIGDPFLYDFPKTNGPGFFNFLLQNIGFLKEKLKGDPDLIPFAKYLIVKIEEELMSLRPYLNDLDNLKELEVIDLAYQTEYAINSCFITVYPLWYNMARLMKVLDKLMDINSKLKKMEGRKTHGGEIFHCSAISPNRILEGPSASSFNEVMVGLEEEADKIVENLIYGYKEIVAIVGMPGLGKTTMANKVYNAPTVRDHFNLFAYCIVSQVYSTRKILLDILGDIRGKDDSMHEMMEEDLADMLRKCLFGERYLIVMDDIWDVKPWDDIKSSLPDNRNGSKVLFTTRNRNVALLAQEYCILHPLRFLSNGESWELLRKKAFQEKEDCPPDFLEVGMMIAQKCKGLPLTVVLVAGLLRTERSLSWWNKISEAVSSYVFTESVMSVLEFSYQHLPEHLKPCFLYFGAFVEDKLIRVTKLALLWIAEGFVLTSKQENLENVARGYLNDLVDRSLVITAETSSYGGIKSCRVHDLVFEFCQRKAQEENILQLMVGYKASNSSSSILCNPYRVCINMKEKYVSDATNICPSIHSLLVSCKWKIRCHDRYDLSNLKFVQVMDLEELDCDARFLREMHSVVHLRFMAISLSSKWSPAREFSLDKVISNWWNLEILILSGFRPGKFPEAIWNMTKLMHVYLNQCWVSISGVKKREAYPYPQMVNLESFSSILVSSTEDLDAFLQMSPSLRKLSFRSTDDSIHFPKVDSLSRLESLKVDHVGKACLRSFNFLSYLKKLSLIDCDLDWRGLSVISEMPCLEVLKLLEDSFVGPEWDMDDTEFPNLKYLKLQKLELSKWIVYPESFPFLEVLIVDRCDKLNEIPPCFGEIMTLKMIKVNALHKVVASSAVEIEKSQIEYGNKVQVMIEYDE